MPRLRAIALAAIATALAARTATASPRVIDLQVDPTPLFLHGFAPEVGLTLGRHRAFATVVAYDVPGAIAEDDRFDERRRAIIGGGYEYFVRHDARGPFVGASVTVVLSRFTLASTGTTRDTTTFKTTGRIGWLFHPLRAAPGLVVAPWIGPSINVAPETFAIDGVAIKRRTVGALGAIQVGWSFDL